MHVFIAGGSGAIGVPLTRALISGGHQVTASTRSAANAAMLKSLGANPAIVDALDADALRRAVVAAHPTHVVHQLTALPKGGPKSARDLEADQPAAHRRHPQPDRCRRRRWRQAHRRRILCADERSERPASRRGSGRGRSPFDGIADPRGERHGRHRRRGAALRPVLRSRRRIDSRDDGDGEATHAAGDPRRPQPPAVHSRGRCGERDGGGAGSRAGRLQLRHRGRRAGELQRDCPRRGRCGGRAEADRGTIVAAAARGAVHGEDRFHAPRPVQSESVRRDGVAPVVSGTCTTASRGSARTQLEP